MILSAGTQLDYSIFKPCAGNHLYLAPLDLGIIFPRTDVPVAVGSHRVYSRVLALRYQRLAHRRSASIISLLPGPVGIGTEETELANPLLSPTFSSSKIWNKA